jgi:hypothetical protein
MAERTQLDEVREELVNTQRKLAEAQKWGNILLEIATEKDQQIANVRIALGLPATDEHPSTIAFRARIVNNVEGDTTNE